MAALTILSSRIHQLSGLFSLNDLHKAAGGEQKHRPKYFLANQQTKNLIEEIEKGDIPPISKISGRNGGTYACQEIVVAYAAWISPDIHLATIRAFLNKPQPKQKALPAKVAPRSLYDLDYIKDLRQDDTQGRNIQWWTFDRIGNMAAAGSQEQGLAFFKQTQQLAQRNAKDAERAVTWSLMHIMDGSIKGIGFYGCELAYCEQIARAAVAWMNSNSNSNAVPPTQTHCKGKTS